jgi:hypothetical protein
MVWSLRESTLMMITKLLKPLTLVVPLTIAAAGIDQQTSAQPSEANQKATVATIANMLPVDGCSYPVTIKNHEYAPDTQSVETFHDLVPAGGTLTAEVEYTLTGQIGVVECGFGATRQLPEISVQILRVLE